MAEQTYAVLEGSKVVNVVLLDDTVEFTVGEDQTLELVTGEVGIGFELVDSEWVAPPFTEPESPAPYEDQTVTDAKYQGLAELMQAGISEATARLIVGLPPAEA